MKVEKNNDIRDEDGEIRIAARQETEKRNESNPDRLVVKKDRPHETLGPRQKIKNHDSDIEDGVDRKIPRVGCEADRKDCEGKPDVVCGCTNLHFRAKHGGVGGGMAGCSGEEMFEEKEDLRRN